MERAPTNFPAPPQYLIQASERQLLLLLLEKVDNLHRRINNLEWNQKQNTTTLLQKIEHSTAQLHTTSTQFLYFNSFPFEIRRHIWNLAIPHRLLALTGKTYNRDAYLLRPPAVAHVCREAREVALRNGRMWFSQLDLPAATWTWFSPSKDILLADVKSLVEGIDGAAEHVLVLAEDLYDFLSFDDPAQPWPRLKRISVHFENFERCDLNLWPLGREHDPDVISRLFGLETIRLLELDDDVAVEDICKVLEQAKDPSSALLLNEIRHGSKIVRDQHKHKRFGSWNNELQRILENWLKSQFSRSVLSINFEELLLKDVKLEQNRGLINKAHPWVQRELSAMPKIKPVFAMARTEGFPRLSIIVDD